MNHPVLIEPLVRSLFFGSSRFTLALWRLPHDLRRRLYMVCFPRQFRAYAARFSRTFAPVYRHHRCLFVHVPKVAGISVARSLFGDNTAVSHMTICHFQLVLCRRDFEAALKFAFVRNPWDRLVSAYAFLEAGGYNDHDAVFARNILVHYPTFPLFVRNWLATEENQLKRVHFMPQYAFVCNPGSGPLVNALNHYEALAQGYAAICGRLGIDAPLQHLNVTANRRDYREYYDRETTDAVARIYWRDIELFGYTFDGCDGFGARGHGSSCRL